MSERDQELRRRILNATAELYAEKGYAETTIGDVVAKLRISRRTLYEHFRSLTDLHFALYETALAETLFRIASVDLDDVHQDRMRLALDMLFARIKENPELARAALYEFRLPEKRNLELRRRVLEFFAGVVTHGLEEARRVGRDLPPSSDLVVYGMLGAVEGIIVHVIEAPASERRWSEALEASVAIFHGVFPYDEAFHAGQSTRLEARRTSSVPQPPEE